MSTQPFFIYAVMSIFVSCALACGGGSSESDYTPPVSQGNKEKTGINDTRKGANNQTSVNPPAENSQKPFDHDNKSTPPNNAPTNGSQDSRSPATSPPGRTPPTNGSTSAPPNSDLALQKAAAALAQVREKLQSASASPDILRQLDSLESGVRDLDRVKNQPSTFETVRNLVCAESDVFSLSLLADKRLEVTSRDDIDRLLQSYHQAGELCGDA